MNDLISRQAAIAAADGADYTGLDVADVKKVTDEVVKLLKQLPSAEQEEFEWCHDCREYDQQAHCCHRWTKVILNTVEELKAERKKGRWLTSDDMYETGVCSVCKCDSQEPVSYAITMFNYCPNCGADMRGEK